MLEQIYYDVDKFFDYCASKNLSTKTIGSYEQTLRLLAQYLKDNYKVKSAGDTKELHIDYVVAQLIFDTWIRLGETLAIEETDIDFIRRAILLRAEITKSKKDRYVFFSEEMSKVLRRWIHYKDRYRQSPYVFCTNKGKALKVNNYETNFKKYGERVGLSDIHPHMLRNNFAKRFLMQGGDIYTLSRILGHSSVKITEEAYLEENDLRINYQRYSPLASLKRG